MLVGVYPESQAIVAISGIYSVDPHGRYPGYTAYTFGVLLLGLQMNASDFRLRYS